MQPGLGRSHFIRAPVALHQLPTQTIWKFLQNYVGLFTTASQPPTKICLSAVWKVRSSVALVVAGEPEQWLQIHDRPSPHPRSFGLKETIIFEILSLEFLIWLQGKQ